jgi:hypothetical protein
MNLFIDSAQDLTTISPSLFAGTPMASASDSPLTHSARRLNHLADSLNCQRYLEIGVETGITFHQVNCPHKTGVDPKFIFDLTCSNELNQHGSCEYHEMQSDLFFSKHRRDRASYDLIFIDGLHHFDQVMRDFIHAMAFAHSGTVFLIDDTLPCDVFSSMRDQQQALDLRARYSIGFQGNAWHGDVYQFVLLLSLYFPDYRYRTLLDSNSNPQTIIWFDPDHADTNEWTQVRSLWAAQNLSNCDYVWLLENIDVLQPIEEEEGLRLVVDRVGRVSPEDD